MPAASSRTARDCHAMNMRAAEAIVSSAPKPMKIFPISEVWSQAERSAVRRPSATAGAGGSAEATASVRRGRRAFVQRAIDVVELIGRDDLGIGCRLGVSRHCPVCSGR